MNTCVSVLVFVFSFIVGMAYFNWPQSCRCHIPGRLEGKVALVTDGPSFMGHEIISELARRGAKVLIACQTKEHFDMTRDKVLRSYGTNGEQVNEDFPDEEVKKSLTPIKEEQVSVRYRHYKHIV